MDVLSVTMTEAYEFLTSETSFLLDIASCTMSSHTAVFHVNTQSLFDIAGSKNTLGEVTLIITIVLMFKVVQRIYLQTIKQQHGDKCAKNNSDNDE